MREAKLRSDNDVTAFDINNVTKFLGRHDSNRNGQLEPDEIESGGWPSNPSDYDANGDGIPHHERTFHSALPSTAVCEARWELKRSTKPEPWRSFGDLTRMATKSWLLTNTNKAPLPKPAKTFDENNDGLLEIIELSTMLAKHRRDAGLTKPDVTKIRNLFSRFDLNGDGMITATETSSFYLCRRSSNQHR